MTNKKECREELAAQWDEPVKLHFGEYFEDRYDIIIKEPLRISKERFKVLQGLCDTSGLTVREYLQNGLEKIIEKEVLQR